MSDLQRPVRPFYLTMPSPCPYLEGRLEQRVVAEMRERGDSHMFDQLSEAGFRRSQRWLYRPACPTCSACVSVRVPVAQFTWTRSWRKTWNRNSDLKVDILPPHFEAEHYELFHRYVNGRHGDGGMANMTEQDYREMVESSPANSAVVTFRDTDGKLIAVCLTDRMRHGMSGVYKFFDPLQERRSLGTFTILWHIQECANIGLTYFYLGYWIEQSRKMAYKVRFRPIEMLTAEGWQLLEPGGEAEAER